MDFYRLCKICDPPRHHAMSEAHQFPKDEAAAPVVARQVQGRRSPGQKTIDGLRDAVAFARGDTSKARVTTIMVESIAPPGECDYCDRRRAINAASASKRRKRQKADVLHPPPEGG